MGYRNGFQFWITETGYKRSKFSNNKIAEFMNLWCTYVQHSNTIHKSFWYSWRGDFDYGILAGISGVLPVYNVYKAFIHSH